MTIAKVTSGVILIIMAATWAGISYKLCEMVPVSDNFIYLGTVLAVVIQGGGISDFLAQKFQVKK